LSLFGRGVLAIWNGIASEAEEEFLAWHVREHIPERVSLPGFLRGRRYIAVDAKPKYFNFYETDSASDLASPAYLARLDAPTDWTRKMVRCFNDTSRTVCDVQWTEGNGEGGSIEAIVMNTGEEPGIFAANLHRHLLTAYHSDHGLTGIHLLKGKHDASRQDTAEARLRSTADRIAPWILLVEASSIEALRRLRIGKGSDAELFAARAGAIIQRGIYQIQFSLSK
jgi:hypothetical protein